MLFRPPPINAPSRFETYQFRNIRRFRPALIPPVMPAKAGMHACPPLPRPHLDGRDNI
jgi:hypothetical protein